MRTPCGEGRESGEEPVKKCASSLLVDLQRVCVCVCVCVCLCACMCVGVQSDDNMVLCHFIINSLLFTFSIPNCLSCSQHMCAFTLPIPNVGKGERVGWVDVVEQ